MAGKEVVWTPTAINSLKEITDFYFEITNSDKFGNILIEKLNNLILNIQDFNLLGKQAGISALRVLYFNNFGIFYELAEENIYIKLIWDARRNPDDLKKLLELES